MLIRLFRLIHEIRGKKMLMSRLKLRMEKEEDDNDKKTWEYFRESDFQREMVFRPVFDEMDLDLKEKLAMDVDVRVDIGRGQGRRGGRRTHARRHKGYFGQRQKHAHRDFYVFLFLFFFLFSLRSLFISNICRSNAYKIGIVINGRQSNSFGFPFISPSLSFLRSRQLQVWRIL